MRDRLNLNNFSLLPIVQDEMSGLAVATCVKGYAPNISNGYYGYQPLAAGNNKSERPQQQHEQMEVTVTENNETRNHRKRAWNNNCADIGVLKKRRENDATDDRGQQLFVKKWDVRFLEELLRGTHGGDLYNYYGAGDDV